ncbi:hypothetical protein ASD04_16780 [Devosia sp. Root436]|nr:hypothetical protein ASD04_16780 [Devosia sp. Root436]
MPDGFEDEFGTGEDVVVPEAEKAETLGAEIGVAGGIGRGFSVLGAVGFDNELVRQANKIRDIVAYRKLAAKLVVRETSVAEKKP